MLCFRYGPSAFLDYKKNLTTLLDRVDSLLHSGCLFLWRGALPVTTQALGRSLFYLPEDDEYGIDLPTMHYDLLPAHLHVKEAMLEHSHQVLDLYSEFKSYEHLRRPDGVHWNSQAHRWITNAWLNLVWEMWGTSLLLNVDVPQNQEANISRYGGPINKPSYMEHNNNSYLAPRDQDGETEGRFRNIPVPANKYDTAPPAIPGKPPQPRDGAHRGKGHGGKQHHRSLSCRYAARGPRTRSAPFRQRFQNQHDEVIESCRPNLALLESNLDVCLPDLMKGIQLLQNCLVTGPTQGLPRYTATPPLPYCPGKQQVPPLMDFTGNPPPNLKQTPHGRDIGMPRPRRYMDRLTCLGGDMDRGLKWQPYQQRTRAGPMQDRRVVYRETMHPYMDL